MRHVKYTSLLALVIMVGSSMGCSMYYRRANDTAIEKLRQRLVAESFDDIYRDTSNITRAQLTLDEFIKIMKVVTVDLKAIDSEIKWARNTTVNYDESVFRDDNFSSLDLEGNGSKVNVTLDWAGDFKLCGMSTSTDVNDGGKRIFRNCD